MKIFQRMFHNLTETISSSKNFLLCKSSSLRAFPPDCLFRFCRQTDPRAFFTHQRYELSDDRTTSEKLGDTKGTRLRERIVRRGTQWKQVEFRAAPDQRFPVLFRLLSLSDVKRISFVLLE